MRLSDIVDELDLEVICCPDGLDREVRSGYASDLMSDVIAHADEDALWITLQIHANVPAVAVMKGLAAVVLTGGRRPETDAAEKARDQGVPILSTSLDSFQLVGRLYEMGIGR